MTDPVVERFREQIADQDRAILRAVNARLQLVAQLRHHKKSVGMEFVDTGQEERLLEALEKANAGPLSREGLRQLWSEILALMKREI
jgi:chorismate mutase